MKHVTMIAFDKTGTLTQGILTVKSVFDIQKKFKYDLPDNQSQLQMSDLL